MRSYAQNFEDVILARALGDVCNGTYIDVGAFHPILDSVSKAFAINGWKGLHVEPVTEYAELLRADRPNDHVLEAVVSDTKGRVDFYEVRDTGLSTLSSELAASYRDRFDVRAKTVEALTIDDLLDLCPAGEIHWLKIDVEGAENSVMGGWKESSRRPWILVVESTQPGTQIHSFTSWHKSLSNKGYKYVYSDGLNRFYLHSSKSELKRHFRYPPNVFDGFQLTENSRHVISLVNEFRHRISELEVQQSDPAPGIDGEFETRLSKAYDELISKQSDMVSREQALRLEAAERERVASQSALAREAALEEHVGSLQAQLHQVRADAFSREQSFRTEVDERERMASEAASAREAALEDRIVSMRSLLDQARSEAASLEASARTNAIAQDRAASAREAILEDRIVSLQLLLDQVRSDAMSSEQALKQEAAEREAMLRQERQALQRRVNISEKRRLKLWKERDEDSDRRIIAVARDRHKLDRLKTDLIILTAKLTTLGAALTDRPPNGSSRPLINGATSGEWVDDQLNRVAPRGATDGFVADKNVCHTAATEVRDHWRTYTEAGGLISFPEARSGMATNSIDNIVDLLALPSDEFVAHVYSVFLGRSPTSAESMLQTGRLRAGCGRPTFLFDVGTSTEAVAHREYEWKEGNDDQFIAQVYLAYYQRTPNRPEFEHHLASLTNGQSRADWSRSIAGSNEAREVRSLRFELDEMIRNKIRNRGCLGWIGRSKRNRALRNLEFEVIRRLKDRYNTDVNSFQIVERDQSISPDRPSQQTIASQPDRDPTRTMLSSEGSQLERHARRTLLRFCVATR